MVFAPSRNPSPGTVLVTAPLLLAFSACGDGPQPVEAGGAARPVEVLVLQEVRPQEIDRVPGLVSAYRSTELAFEVSGRLERVPAVGSEVQGPVLDADGNELRPGEVIASVDATKYERALRRLQTQRRSAVTSLEAKRVDREQVATREIDALRARVRKAELEIETAEKDNEAARISAEVAADELKRAQQLFAAGDVAQADVDRAEQAAAEADAAWTARRVTIELRQQAVAEASAALAQAEAGLLLKDADIEVAQAQLDELDEQIAQAEEDVESCVLRAPYSGRLTEVLLGPGSTINAGQTIAKISLLEPMRIAVTMSAANERALLAGTQVRWAPRNAGPIPAEVELVGSVYEKSGVGDVATGTFEVGIITANPTVLAAPPAPEHADAPIVEELFPVIDPHDEEALYLLEDCLFEEDGKAFVLRVSGIEPNQPNRDQAPFLVPEKIEVALGPGFREIAEFRLRQITGPAELAHRDWLVQNPTAELAEGFVLTQRERLLRPGDVVAVEVPLQDLPEGLYIPIQAISELNGTTSVFLEADGAVTRVPVEVHETWGDLRRISGVGISAGSRVVSWGAHFLADGETVQVVTAEEQVFGRGGRQ